MKNTQVLKNLSHKIIIFFSQNAMTTSKRQTVNLENDPLYKDKKDWSQRFKNLIGKRIVSVRYLTKEETDASGWYSAPIVIELEDGQALIPQQDDEGNDGGALWIANSKCLDDLIPVIRG
tara:strand:+ start:3094 stop:3453 length:360 start_codon:yes stop_codon:yes gene_type:complete